MSRTHFSQVVRMISAQAPCRDRHGDSRYRRHRLGSHVREQSPRAGRAAVRRHPRRRHGQGYRAGPASGLCPHLRRAGHPPSEISIPQALQSASSSARYPSRRLTSAPERHPSQPACERVLPRARPRALTLLVRGMAMPPARRRSAPGSCQRISTCGTRAARQSHGACLGRWLVDDVKQTGRRCRWLMRAGGIAAGEMVCTFKCRIGLVLVVARDEPDASVQALVNVRQDEVFTIGEVTSPGVEILNTEWNH
ncbi:hypothetical protein EDB86DRAFT_3024127 [Lactarius hatsudake]|nr:hypothetical protein EDB86DRAFT_3024127 [Lactarius hatsudake]